MSNDRSHISPIARSLISDISKPNPPAHSEAESPRSSAPAASGTRYINTKKRQHRRGRSEGKPFQGFPRSFDADGVATALSPSSPLACTFDCHSLESENVTREIGLADGKVWPNVVRSIHSAAPWTPCTMVVAEFRGPHRAFYWTILPNAC